MDDMEDDDLFSPVGPEAQGRVCRLKSDWDDLLDVLPRLHSSAVVFRNRQAIHCHGGRFPAVHRSGEKVFYSEGHRGMSLQTDHWAEAWWYEEERHGMRVPCVEIADEMGRGLLKICYRYQSDAAEDEACLQELVESEGDAWDLLHVQRSNLMRCDPRQSERLARGPLIDLLRDFHAEAMAAGTEVGLIMPHGAQTTWDLLCPSPGGACRCWLNFGDGAQFVSIQPGTYQSCDFTNQEDRLMLNFYLSGRRPALSLILPNDHGLESLARLKMKSSCQP